MLAGNRIQLSKTKLFIAPSISFFTVLLASYLGLPRPGSVLVLTRRNYLGLETATKWATWGGSSKSFELALNCDGTIMTT